MASYWDVFFAKYPTWETLAAASVADIEDLLQPIGLSKQRAPRLHRLATILASRGGQFPDERSALEELPGVGQYIANAIMLFSHRAPYPLLDVNMARVLERVFGSRRLADIRHDPYLQGLASEFVRHRKIEAVNWAVLDLAAAPCKPRGPSCGQCPLQGMCRYARTASSRGSRGRNRAVPVEKDWVLHE